MHILVFSSAIKGSDQLKYCTHRGNVDIGFDSFKLCCFLLVLPEMVSI